MSVNTKGKISRAIIANEIRDALQAIGATEIEIAAREEHNGTLGYPVKFDYQGEKRSPFVFIDFKKGETELLLGAYGKSVEIIRGIMEHFGGYMIDSDAGGEYYYVSKQTGEINPNQPFYELVEGIGAGLNVQQRLAVADFIIQNKKAIAALKE